MDKTLRIKAEEVESMAKKDLRRSAYLMIGTMLFIFPMMLLTNKSGSTGIMATVFSVVFSSMIFAGIILYMYSFKKLFYQNLLITVNKEGIEKLIDIDNKPELKGFHKMNWERVKSISPQHNIKISWNDVTKLKENKNGLILKTKKSNAFNGGGQIHIPTELEEYATLKELITKVTSEKNS